MSFALIYLIGFAVTWTVETVHDNLKPDNYSPLVVFLGRSLICTIWPVVLPQVLGVVIASVVRKLGK